MFSMTKLKMKVKNAYGKEDYKSLDYIRRHLMKRFVSALHPWKISRQLIIERVIVNSV